MIIKNCHDRNTMHYHSECLELCRASCSEMILIFQKRHWLLSFQLPPQLQILLQGKSGWQLRSNDIFFSLSSYHVHLSDTRGWFFLTRLEVWASCTMSDMLRWLNFVSTALITADKNMQALHCTTQRTGDCCAEDSLKSVAKDNNKEVIIET